MTDNLKLWNAVEGTNPKHTTPVTFGRGFTAIDPYQQVKSATAQFGAAGDKWGWEIMDTKFLTTDQVAVRVRLWHGGETYIEQWGQVGMYIDGAKQKPDGDCLKKATTDGVTKCLSYLGFNADVFLGKFDDNKYVAEQRAKFEEGGAALLVTNEPKPPKPNETDSKHHIQAPTAKEEEPWREYSVQIESMFNNASTKEELTEMFNSNKKGIDKMVRDFKEMGAAIREEYRKKSMEFK